MAISKARRARRDAVHAAQEQVNRANPDIKVKNVPDKGRALIWEPSDGRSVEPGTTLLKLTPRNVTLSEAEVSRRCNFCCRLGGYLTPCSGCHLLNYCSTSCKEKDKDGHQVECNAIIALKKASGKSTKIAYDPGAGIRSIARLFWLREKKGEDWWAPIAALQGQKMHNTDVHGLMKSAQETLAFMKYAEGEKLPTLDEIVDVIDRTKVNGWMALSERTCHPFGGLLETTSSLINHSCTPNVIIHHPEGYGVEKPTRVIALKALKPGDELVCSYIDSSVDHDSRQNLLKHRWNFTCHCDLCLKTSSNSCTCSRCDPQHTMTTPMKGVDQPWVDPRSALLCGREGCTGWTALCRVSVTSVGLCTKCKQSNTLKRDKIKDTLTKAWRFLEVRQQQGSAAIRAEDTLSAMAPILRDLSLIQPPCSTECHRIVTELLQEMNSFKSIMGGIKGDYALDHFYLTSAQVAGMKQGDEQSIEPKGSKKRCLAIEQLAHIYLIDAPKLIKAAKARRQGGLMECNFLTSVSPLQLDINKVEAKGRAILREAVEEFLIGSGKELGGGVRGRELKDLLDFHEDCAKMMGPLKLR